MEIALCPARALHVRPTSRAPEGPAWTQHPTRLLEAAGIETPPISASTKCPIRRRSSRLQSPHGASSRATRTGLGERARASPRAKPPAGAAQPWSRRGVHDPRGSAPPEPMGRVQVLGMERRTSGSRIKHLTLRERDVNVYVNPDRLSLPAHRCRVPRRVARGTSGDDRVRLRLQMAALLGDLRTEYSHGHGRWTSR